jgi:hypothetical protein
MVTTPVSKEFFMRSAADPTALTARIGYVAIELPEAAPQKSPVPVRHSPLTARSGKETTAAKHVAPQPRAAVVQNRRTTEEKARQGDLPLHIGLSVSTVLQGHEPTAEQKASASATKDLLYGAQKMMLPMASAALSVGSHLGLMRAVDALGPQTSLGKMLGVVFAGSTAVAYMATTAVWSSVKQLHETKLDLADPSGDPETLRNRALVRPLTTSQGGPATRPTAELLLDLKNQSGAEAAFFQQAVLGGLSDSRLVQALSDLAAHPVDTAEDAAKVRAAVAELTTPRHDANEPLLTNAMIEQFQMLQPEVAAAELREPSNKRSALLVTPGHLLSAMVDCAFNGTLNVQNQTALRDPQATQPSLLTRLKTTTGAEGMASTAALLNEMVALTVRENHDLQQLKTALHNALNKPAFVQALVDLSAQPTEMPYLRAAELRRKLVAPQPE